MKVFCQWQDCVQHFDDDLQLLEHMKFCHSNEPYICKWKDCYTTKKSKDYLVSHLLVHISAKRFKCEDCNRSFKRKQDMSILLTQTNIR